jgi:hypothetical protein
MWFRKKDKSINIPGSASGSPFGPKEVSDAVAKALSGLYPRIQALNEYSEHLLKLDQKVSDFMDSVISQSQWSYKNTVRLYIGTYLIALGTFVVGLILLIVKLNLFYGIPALAGLIVLILLFSRNPLKNFRYWMDNLVKLNILYVGYNRQLHQVDATFKDLLSHPEGVDSAKMEEMLGYVQAAVDETIRSISQLMDEIGE